MRQNSILSLGLVILLVGCGDDSTESNNDSVKAGGTDAATAPADSGLQTTRDAAPAVVTPVPDASPTAITADAAAPVVSDAGAPVDASAPTMPSMGMAMGTLLITAVHASRIGQNLHLEVIGSGFGPAPMVLPAVAILGSFRIVDSTQGSWCAGGANPNCPVSLQCTSWTDTRIVIDGFGAEYGGQYKMLEGDSVKITVRSTDPAAGGAMSVWTGTLTNEAPPVLRSSRAETRRRSRA